MNGPARFVDAKLTLYDVLDLALVVCPRCAERAVVRPEDPRQGLSGRWRLVCGSCGLLRARKAKALVLGAPVDPVFNERLWLDHVWGRRRVWAYNDRHLDYLESFVAAELRSRLRSNPRCSGCSLISRLPRWMKDASNRPALLAIFAAMRTRRAARPVPPG